MFQATIHQSPSSLWSIAKAKPDTHWSANVHSPFLRVGLIRDDRDVLKGLFHELVELLWVTCQLHEPRHDLHGRVLRPSGCGGHKAGLIKRTFWIRRVEVDAIVLI